MSRAAGIKLAAALDHFHLDVAGRICLDVGASTGGFSEVLAVRGARRIYAVDVGTGQLHPRVAARSEIVAMEQTDIRTLDPARLAEPPDFAAVDVSFISLKLVLPAIGKLLRARATIVALIKPQFEAARAAIKKGIVRDPAVHASGLRRHRGVLCRRRLARRRRDPLADPGRRRQPRISHRGGA